jgi:hypothetical protein
MRRALFLSAITAFSLSTSAVAGDHSPHWPHIRTMKTDFGLASIADPVERAQAYDWAASHYDHVVDGSAEEYKRRNPAIRLYPYLLNWSVIQPGHPGTGYGAIEQWYADHPEYRLEDGLLHEAEACPDESLKTAGCRISIRIWDSDRWVVNPGDAGMRAYQQSRMRRAAAHHDGVFLDEHGASDLQSALKAIPMREYPGAAGWARYLGDLVELIRLERAALAPDQRLILNVWQDMTELDRDMALAAGGAHTEGLNNPREPIVSRWQFVERLLADGLFVDFVTPDFPHVPAGYSGGNQSSPLARAQLWMLASYYMVVPANPDRFSFHINGGWSAPLREQWIGAQEVDVGRPVGERFLFAEGNDRRHRSYQVWGRKFDRALVLVRPAAFDEEGLVFDDDTAVEISLPSDTTYHSLSPEGQVAGQPMRRITLRNSEAAIFIKRHSASDAVPPLDMIPRSR